MEIIKGVQPVPWMIFVYGVPGIGKSTVCAHAPKPLFLDIEGGISRVECDKTPRLKTMQEVRDALMFAYKAEDYSTVVIDTVDALEDLLRRDVLKANNWKNLESPGYGKGHTVFAEAFADLLANVERFKAAGKNVIFVGHDQIKSHAAPDTEAYDRYIPKLAKSISGLLVCRSDAVLFCQNEHIAKTCSTDEERVRGVGTGKRLIRTQETPAWIAKNRFGLPPTMELKAELFTYLK